MLTPNEYQEQTGDTEIYTEAAESFLNRFLGEGGRHQFGWNDSNQMLSVMYCAGKLNGEAGEVAELIFKSFRNGSFEPEILQKLFKELGDVQWYIARLAAIFGWSLEDVMQANLDKLQDRKNRGVLHGYGDER